MKLIIKFYRFVYLQLRLVFPLWQGLLRLVKSRCRSNQRTNCCHCWTSDHFSAKQKEGNIYTMAVKANLCPKNNLSSSPKRTCGDGWDMLQPIFAENYKNIQLLKVFLGKKQLRKNNSQYQMKQTVGISRKLDQTKSQVN